MMYCNCQRDNKENIHLPQEFLIASLAIQFAGAEWIKKRKVTGEEAQWSLFNKNWNSSKLITVRLLG